MAVRRPVPASLFEFKTGRQFRRRPTPSTVQGFLQHTWRTGRPHEWPLLTTTPHPKGQAPAILAPFPIPAHLRGGRDLRAPCSICSPAHPKFEHGFLVHCSDGFLRIIGHECGHHFFDEDSYADALSQYEAETEEGTARNLLADRMPDLARTLLEAMTVARGLNDLLSFREHLVASITQRAAAALRRARTGDQLWVEVPSHATDDKGRTLLEKKVIATVGGLDALVPRSKLLGDLVQSIHDGDRVLIIERDEIAERLAAMSRHEAFGAAKTVRRLDQSLSAAKAERQNLCALLGEDGLKGLSVWGRHSQRPTPFWIEIASGRRAYASKGLRPRYWERGGHMMMPPLSSYDPVEVR